MNRRVSLGRIWTVPIQGTYSLFVLVLIVGSLASWEFMSILRGYHAGAYILAGLFSAALFIWTVFAHEAAHVAAARRYRARVNGVTLSLLGGETAISGQPGSPWQGIVVATAGPGVSVLCGGAGVGAAYALSAVHGPPLASLSLAWVGLLCIMLAIVNLLPAAPLDGGHVLQSVVWAKTGSRTRASAISGRAGQVLGIGMIGGAVWLAVAGGAWYTVAATAVVGVPLWRGASAVRRAAEQRARLVGVRVKDLLRSGEPALRDDDTVKIAARRLGDRSTGYAGVVDEQGRPVAILSVARVLQWAGEHAANPVIRMTKRHSRVPTAAADEPVADVLERTNARARPVAVTRDGKLIGVLDPDDVLAAMRDAEIPAGSGSEPTPDDWPGVEGES